MDIQRGGCQSTFNDVLLSARVDCEEPELVILTVEGRKGKRFYRTLRCHLVVGVARFSRSYCLAKGPGERGRRSSGLPILFMTQLYLGGAMVFRTAGDTENEPACSQMEEAKSARRFVPRILESAGMATGILHHVRIF